MYCNRNLVIQNIITQYQYSKGRTISHRPFFNSKSLTISILAFIIIIFNTIQGNDSEDKFKAKRVAQDQFLTYDKIIENPNMKKILEACKDNTSKSSNNLKIKDDEVFDAIVNFEVNFKNTWYLDLSNLDIDDIPGDVYKKLINLKILNLSHNPRINLNSDWFKVLGPKLIELNISYCDIETKDIEQLEICKQLKILNISGNKMIDLNNANLSILSNELRELYVSEIFLSKEGLENIIGLENLEVLDISKNPLYHVYKNLKNFNKLEKTVKSLNLSSTGLRFKDMPKIQNFKNLQKLNISDNNLYEYEDTYEKVCFHRNVQKMLKNNCGLRSMRSGSNSRNPLTNNYFLGQLADKLIELNVDKTDISQNTLEDIFKCSKLEILKCSYNDLSNIRFNARNWPLQKSLKEVSLNYCELESQKFLNIIFSCHKLEKLEIFHNFFRNLNFNIENLGIKKTLKHLDMKRNDFEIGKIFKKLRDFGSIEYLDLSYNNMFNDYNRLDNDINLLGVNQNIHYGYNSSFQSTKYAIQSKRPNPLQKSLKELYLSNLKATITNQFLFNLTNCPNLEILNLSGNRFESTGFNIAFGIASESLTKLYLSDCSLIGDIHLRKIVNFPKLELLDISYNKELVFEINFKFGSIANTIKELLISHCNSDLTMFLREIAKCTKIEILDISSNKLDLVSDKFNFGTASKTLKIIKASQLISKRIQFCEIFTKCEMLEELDISNNSLNTIPKSFLNSLLPLTLKKLNISNNNFKLKNDFMVLREFKNLIELDISDCFITLPKKYDLGNLKYSIKKINAINCITDNNLINAILDCKNLEELDVSNLYSRKDNDYFLMGKSKKSLRKLNIYYYDFCIDQLIRYLSVCENLCELEISGIFNEKNIDLFNLGQLKNTLRKLKIIDCSIINPKIIKEFTDCPKLESIEIATFLNVRTDYDIVFGCSRKSLEKIVLNIEEMKITNKSLIYLTSCPRLKELKIMEGRFVSKNYTFGNSKCILENLYLPYCNNHFSNLRNCIKKCPYLRENEGYENYFYR